MPEKRWYIYTFDVLLMAKNFLKQVIAFHNAVCYNFVKFLYFSKEALIKSDVQITPSMSRRGNPYDNALAENFFSILKTECIHRVKLSGYDEARLIISEYINFYNNYRIQTKTKLTPLEKRNQFVA